MALLLAMWDTAAGPIRCLDEWDVFLDQSNRALAGSMLVSVSCHPWAAWTQLTASFRQIDGARESDGRQYVLITPQTMSNVPTGGDCKIIRLSDPERNQCVDLVVTEISDRADHINNQSYLELCPCGLEDVLVGTLRQKAINVSKTSTVSRL